MKCFPLSRSLVFAGLVALLSGCATLTPGPTVGVSVVNLRPLQSTMLETGLELTLRLTNEAAQPLVLAGSTHQLCLNESYVGRAVSNERVTVRPSAPPRRPSPFTSKTSRCSARRRSSPKPPSSPTAWRAACTRPPAPPSAACRGVPPGNSTSPASA